MITGTITALSEFLNGNVLARYGSSMQSISKLINNTAGFSTTSAEGIKAMSAAVEGLSYSDQALILAQNNVAKSSIALTLATNGAESADISAAMASIGNATAKEKLTEAELADILTLQYGNRERAVAVASQIAKTTADQNGMLAIEKLSVSELKNIATTNGLTTAEAANTAQMLGMSSATIGLSGAMATLGGVLKSILIAVKTIAPELIAVGVAVTGIVAIYKSINKVDSQRTKAAEQAKKRKEAYEEEIASAKKLSSEYTNSAKSLNGYVEKYTDLNSKIITSSEDKEELISIQNELIQTYGSEAAGIDLVNGKYEENIRLITTLAQKEKERARENAQAAYYDSKSNTRLTGADGGNYIVDQYTGTSRRYSDEVYKKMMVYADALQMFSESTFGDGSYWGSETFLTLNSQMSNDELVKSLDILISDMDKYFDREEKATKTWQEQYAMLTSLREEALQKQKEDAQVLANYANTVIDSYVLNGIDVSNVTEETYQSWRDGMIESFASDDPQLESAIDEKLSSIFAWLQDGEIVPVKLDLSSFLNSEELADAEKMMGKIQTAYKNIEEGKALDSEILSNFPELAPYLDDTEKLKEKLQEIGNLQMQPFIDQLKEIQSSLTPDSDDYKTINNVISWLEKQADVTTKVKEKTTKTSDLYKDQKKQIHENINALNREISSIEKQVDSLEKKKKSQEEYIKLLEKEKDRLEDLIDDYETAADVAKDFLSSQIDGLEKQKDSIEDYYEEQTKAAEDYYDEQIELISQQAEAIDTQSTIYDTQIDNIEAQIKAIRDEADEQDRLNDLKEKELALEKAKSQRVRVYDATRGWVK